MLMFPIILLSMLCLSMVKTWHVCDLFLQWQTISLTVIEKVQIAAAILGSLFLMASISWLVWSSFSPSARWQRQDLLFQICYGMYGFMDVVCIGKEAKHWFINNFQTDWAVYGVGLYSPWQAESEFFPFGFSLPLHLSHQLERYGKK